MSHSAHSRLFSKISKRRGERQGDQGTKIEGPPAGLPEFNAEDASMASCPKCGNHPLRKPKGKPRRCKRCGSSVGAVRTAQIALALSQQVSA